MSSVLPGSDTEPTDPMAFVTTQPQSVAPAIFHASDVERELKRLENVTSVRVRCIDGEIEEIHVIAPLKSAPKKIVRNIETLVFVHFGIRLDHRRISIVQVDEPQPASPRPSRARIRTLKKADGMVRLDLAVEDRLIRGEAQVSAEDGDMEAGGRAVLHATERLLASPGVLHLLESRIVEFSENRVVLVLIRSIETNHEELLLGASLIHADPFTAMAEATLDAVNRRLVQAAI